MNSTITSTYNMFKYKDTLNNIIRKINLFIDYQKMILRYTTPLTYFKDNYEFTLVAKGTRYRFTKFHK